MRTVTDRNGRRYSVADTPSRSLDYPSTRRRTTVVGLSNELEAPRHLRCQSSPENIYRRSSFETTPGSRKGGNMSKVVRSVKNVTKGYSAPQVKVRNGKNITRTISYQNTQLGNFSNIQ